MSLDNLNLSECSLESSELKKNKNKFAQTNLLMLRLGQMKPTRTLKLKFALKLRSMQFGLVK